MEYGKIAIKRILVYKKPSAYKPHFSYSSKKAPKMRILKAHEKSIVLNRFESAS